MDGKKITVIGDVHAGLQKAVDLQIKGFEGMAILEGQSQVLDLIKNFDKDKVEYITIDSITCMEITPENHKKKKKEKAEKTGFNPFPMFGTNPNEVFNQKKTRFKR